MKQAISDRQWWTRQLSYLLAATVLSTLLLRVILVGAVAGGSVDLDWSSPPAAVLKRVGPLPDIQDESNFLDNLDCTPITYRTPFSSSMLDGCFTQTALGLVDGDTGMTIFNGTDEAVPILPYSPNQVIMPWPNGMLVSLSSLITGGDYLGFYSNPLAVLHNNRNLLLQLESKSLTAPAQPPVVDSNGNRLEVVSQTLAFSSAGSWLVAETLSGSFVRVNLSNLEVMPFAKSYGAAGVGGMPKSRISITDNGRYAAIATDSVSQFKVFDLSSCDGLVPNLTVALPPKNCAVHDYWPFIAGQVKGLESVRHVRFVNDGLLSFEARSSISDEEGVYEIAPGGSITSLIDYLGLGDSYTSGEGNFDYRAGTDTDDNKCHLSVNSYPLLLTRDLFSPTGGHSVACSGAVIKDVGSRDDNYKGQVRGVAKYADLRQSQPLLLEAALANFIPGYMAQQRFVSNYQPAITTVSVGGDDIGFGDILERCAIYHVSFHLSDNTCFNTYEDRQELLSLIDRTIPRWTGLYKQLRAEAPATRLYVIGYPQIADDTGNCGLNVHFNKNELEFAEELVDYLNGSIKQAADKAKVTYVDISHALYEHRLCEASGHGAAMNGLTAGNDTGPIGHESYHPNALGQQLIEQAILKQTHGLTSGESAASETATAAQKLAQAPKSGRQLNTRVPASSLTDRIIRAGQAAPVKIAGVDTGLKPGTTYTVRLDGPTGAPIGTVTTNGGGDINGSVTLPGDTVPGGHTIDVTGNNQNDEPVDVTQPIYVPAQDNDSDGDQIQDGQDSCPYAINSGQDGDSDGIDDSCDPVIGQAFSGPGTTSKISGSTISGTVETPKRAKASRRFSTSSSKNGGKTIPRAETPSTELNLSPNQSHPGSSQLRGPSAGKWLLYIGLAIMAWWWLLIAAYLIKRQIE